MRFRLLLVVVVPVLALIALATLLVLDLPSFQHWLAVHTGTEYGGPDKYYNFWSGFGADLGEVTLVTTVVVGVYTAVRRTNCHVRGCWRIGHHPLEGTPYHLCAKHHPDVPATGATHADILEHHHRAMRDRIEHREHGVGVAAKSPPLEGAAAATSPAQPR